MPESLPAENDLARQAMSELGRHVFGGGWLDHAAECALGNMSEATCTCGLTEWLKKYSSLLGVTLDAPARTSDCPHCPGFYDEHGVLLHASWCVALHADVGGKL